MDVAKSKKIAFCGICSALSLVIMILSGLIPVATIALPAVAGCVLIAVTAELNEKYAFSVFAVVSVLSFFLTADREAFLIYVLFFGYYPALVSIIMKIKNLFLQYAVKLALFNIACVLDFFIVTFIFSIPLEETELFGKYAPLILLALANVVFIIYDRALIGVISEYFRRIHPIAKKFVK